MTYDEILAQVLELLQCEGRLSYRAPKRRFDLDNDDLEDLKVEFIQVAHLEPTARARIPAMLEDVTRASHGQA